MQNKAKMNKTKILSALLAMLFILQTIPFVAFNVYATEPEGITETEPTETETETEEDEFYIDPEADFEDNKVLVRFKKEYSDPDIEMTAADFPTLNVESVKNYVISAPDENFVRDIAIILATHDKNEVIAACEELLLREDVLSVFPSYIISLSTELVPNDPDYNDSTNPTNRAPYMLTNTETAWNTTTGSSNVKVAVLDTKVDKHSDFGSNLITGFDPYDGSTITDDNASPHGTGVSSVIGAKGNNNSYSSGVCWNISIVPIQIKLNESSENNQAQDSIDAIAEALNYCRLNDIGIINCSFGQYQNDSYYNQVKSWIDDWGGIVVTAAGNDRKNTDELSHNPSNISSKYVISVGAYNSAGTNLWVDEEDPTQGSNYGKETVDILAPGQNIYVLHYKYSYDIVSGTSVAAPFVTGAAALLKSKYPEATSEEIIAALKLGCQHYPWTHDVSKYGCLKIDRSLNLLASIIENGIPVENGTYILGTENNSFQVLDITNNSVNNAASTQIFEANGSNSQKFEIEYNCKDATDPYYTIKNINSGLYLEAAEGNTTAGTAVQQNQWTDDDSQKWMIKHVSDDIYVIKNKKSGLAIDFGVSSPANGQSVTLQIAANSTDQKFRIIPSGENVAIPDGLYRISYKNNTSLNLCNLEDNIDLRSSGTVFKVTNFDGYCHISEFYGNKAIDLTNGGTAHLTNIQAATEDYNSNNQKWIIRNTGDGSVYITSYITNKVMGAVNNSATSGTNIALHTPTGNDSQRFYFEEEDHNGIIDTDFKIGQYCYALNEAETNGIDIKNSLLYDITEGVLQLSFEKQLYGYFTIRDVESGSYLEAQDNDCVTFASKNDTERQLWEIYIDEDTLYLFNIYTEKYLKYAENEDGSIQITMREDEYDPNCKDIIFKNYPIIQEDIEYLIIPKNDVEKAVTIDDTAQYATYPITINNIDFENNNQRFTFEFSDSDDAYRIKSVLNNTKLFLPGFNTPIFNSRGSLFYITQTTDGYYKLGCQGKTFSYVDGSFETTYNKIENDDDQKFMLVPVSDVITDATYQILVGDDETKALSVNDSMVDGSEITIEIANANDISQRFYVYNNNGSYKLISMYSGKTISLSEGLDNIVQAQISENDTLQKWQVVNSTSDESDYSIKLVSYRIGDYLRYNNNALSTSYYSGENDQLFTLKQITSYENNFLGEIVSSVNSDKDIFLDNTQAILSSISINGRNTLRFVEDADGLWTIEDRTSGTLLTCNNNELAFAEDTLSNSQKWLIIPLIDGSYLIFNPHSGRFLINDDGNVSLSNDQNDTNCKFIIHIKGDADNDREISTKDVLYIRKYLGNLIEFSAEDFYRADYNEDGDVSTRDILAIRQFLGGLIEIESQTETSSTFALNNYSNGQAYEIQTIITEDILEMTDEEFLTWLFGDVDFDSLSVTIFE